MKYLKILLSILLIVCLFDMPYGYYQLIRWLSTVLFIFWGIQEGSLRNKNWAFFFYAMAVLFQPIVKISLGRGLWNLVDVIVAVVLIISAFSERSNSENQIDWEATDN